MPYARSHFSVPVRRLVACAATLALAGCGNNTAPPPLQTVDVANVSVNGNPPFVVERGYHLNLTATAKNRLNIVVNVPFVWRSNNEKIVTIDGTGRLLALDTGVTTVYASTLGVNSTPVAVRVVWQGPAKIATHLFTAPSAITAGATPDSLRAIVTDLNGLPVFNARVAFAVTAGGGTISPAIATTDRFGVAAAQWKLGSAEGVNTATATVLGEDDKPFAFVSPSTTSYSIRTFSALSAVDGDKQTGLILSTLPIMPTVRVVDSTGKPRPGVPVTFSATSGGRIEFPIVATGADGVASAGKWTLGDIPGEQKLIAKLEFATVTLTATGTGTPVHFTPLTVTAGSFATCSIVVETTVSCWGAEPLVGDSGTVDAKKPTPTKSTEKFTTLAASIAQSGGHFCGIAVDESLWCWGQNTFPDTSATAKVFGSAVPTKLPNSLAWKQLSLGQAHNCGLASDQNIYCWGDNTAAQLGDRTTKNHYAPAVVFGGFKFASVTSGAGHSCGVTLDGSALCWGVNQNGQLGDGTTAGRSSPSIVTGVISFATVQAGEFFTCGLTTTGRAYCWGNLGTGSGIVTTPRTYPTAPTFTSLTVGAAHVCALTADGTPYCWGNNSVGQLGDSTLVERQTPTPVATALKFKTISAGTAHTCANTADLSVLCWGLNRSGELGDSTSTTRTTPKYLVLEVKP